MKWTQKGNTQLEKPKKADDKMINQRISVVDSLRGVLKETSDDSRLDVLREERLIAKYK